MEVLQGCAYFSVNITPSTDGKGTIGNPIVSCVLCFLRASPHANADNCVLLHGTFCLPFNLVHATRGKQHPNLDNAVSGYEQGCISLRQHKRINAVLVRVVEAHGQNLQNKIGLCTLQLTKNQGLQLCRGNDWGESCVSEIHVCTSMSKCLRSMTKFVLLHCHSTRKRATKLQSPLCFSVVFSGDPTSCGDLWGPHTCSCDVDRAHLAGMLDVHRVTSVSLASIAIKHAMGQWV